MIRHDIFLSGVNIYIMFNSRWRFDLKLTFEFCMYNEMKRWIFGNDSILVFFYSILNKSFSSSNYEELHYLLNKHSNLYIKT